MATAPAPHILCTTTEGAPHSTPGSSTEWNQHPALPLFAVTNPNSVEEKTFLHDKTTFFGDPQYPDLKHQRENGLGDEPQGGQDKGLENPTRHKRITQPTGQNWFYQEIGYGQNTLISEPCVNFKALI